MEASTSSRRYFASDEEDNDGGSNSDYTGDSTGHVLGKVERSSSSNTAKPKSSRSRAKERTRVTHACDRCKFKKARCNGDQPVCSNCAKAKAECVYQPELDGRKRRKCLPEPSSRAQSQSRIEDLSGSEGGLLSSTEARSVSQHNSVLPPNYMATPLPDFSHAHPHSQPQFNHHQWAAPEYLHQSTAYAHLPPGTHLDPSWSSDGGITRSMMEDETLRYYQNAVSLQDHYNSPVHHAMVRNIAIDPIATGSQLLTPTHSTATAQGDPVSHSSPPNSKISAYVRPLASSLANQGSDPMSRVDGSDGHGSHSSEVLRSTHPTTQEVRLARAQYYRPFGATSFQPGFEQTSRTFATPAQPSSFDPAAASSPISSSTQLYPPGLNAPHRLILDHLFPLFFTRLGSQFPFLSLRDLQDLISLASTASGKFMDAGQAHAPLLINAICAVTARFSDHPSIAIPGRDPSSFGLEFAEKTKQLLLPLLGLPTSGTISALVLLAYHDFGSNSDSASWMYIGIAQRMAQDIGLHLATSPVGGDRRRSASDTLLFWALIALDRTLSLAAGRTITLKDYEISVPAPSEDDIQIVAQDSLVPTLQNSTPSAFLPFITLLRLLGQICDIVNFEPTIWTASQGDETDGDNDHPLKEAKPRALVPLEEAKMGRVYSIENEIKVLYENLSPKLIWSTANFQNQRDRGTSTVFLHLHLWYHASLILLYRSPLLCDFAPASTFSLPERLAVVDRACASIREILVVACAMDEAAITSAPSLTQPIFIAISAWIQEYRIRTGRNVLTHVPVVNPVTTGVHHGESDVIAESAYNSFKMATDVLTRQSHYWHGTSVILKLLEQRAGLNPNRSSVKLATESSTTIVSASEMEHLRQG